VEDAEACTDHAHPGRVRMFVASVLLSSLRWLLWGFRISVVAPCMEQAYLLHRISEAGGRVLNTDAPKAPEAPSSAHSAAASKVGQYL